jgi:hypothetical protein
VKSLNSLNQNKNNFTFHKIYFQTFKLFFLFKNNLVYCSIYNEQAINYYIKLHLLHMHVAFINFNGDLIDTIKISTKIEVNILY